MEYIRYDDRDPAFKFTAPSEPVYSVSPSASLPWLLIAIVGALFFFLRKRK